MTEAYLPLLQSDPHHYGGIVVGPNLQPAINDDFEDSDNSNLSKESWATASETSLELFPAPLVRQQPLGYADTETPGQRAPSRHGRGDLPIEQGRVTFGECFKCCKSWDDWCLFLSCNCSSSCPLPLHERKCLRAARMEGWRLLWSFLLPLTLGSLPLQCTWAITQLVMAIALLIICVLSDYLWDTTFAALWDTTFAALWLLLCVADTFICIVIARFRKILRYQFSIVITPLRILYNILCLFPIVVADINLITKYPVPSTCTTGQDNSTSCDMALYGYFTPYFSVTSFIFFVDFVCLVIVARLALKSLEVRNAYSQAIGGPGKREGIRSFECFFTLCVLGEVIIHVLIVVLTSSFTLTAAIYESDMWNTSGIHIECVETVLKSSQVSVVFSLLAPISGIILVFLHGYCYFQNYLISVYLSVCHLSQDRERAAKLNIPMDLCNKLQARQPIMSESDTHTYHEHFKKDFTSCARLVHPCFSPFAILGSVFIPCMLLTYLIIQGTLLLDSPLSPLCLEWNIISTILLVSISALFPLIHLYAFFTFAFTMIMLFCGCVFLGAFSLTFPISLIILLYCYPHQLNCAGKCKFVP